MDVWTYYQVFYFTDSKRQMNLNLSAISKIYVVSAMFENARKCFYTIKFMAQANDRFEEI